MSLDKGSVGKINFIEEHGLWSEDMKRQSLELIKQVKKEDLQTIRVAWGDQHGIVRGKNVMARDFIQSLNNGIDFQTATLFFDTTNNMFAPMFEPDAGIGMPELAGGPDAILVPDPSTFKILPWAHKTGWILSDMHFQSGKACPFDTRSILKKMLKELNTQKWTYVVGIEIEFYITKLLDKMLRPEQSGWPPEPPEVNMISHGFQYLTEDRQDEIAPILDILQQNIEELGLPLRTIEDEWGPGQCEFTFDPREGLEAADNLLLFRTAVKQICRRNELHASFMTRPGLPNFFSSGWHLHQSIFDNSQKNNLFVNYSKSKAPLSDIGMNFIGGILENTSAATAFSTPTINGYKRYAPNSFAPNYINWASEHRGALIRVLGGPNDPGTHIENRAGEPSANPYLYMASQLAAGLQGIKNKISPGEPDNKPYQSNKRLLPRNLNESLKALEKNELFIQKFDKQFIDYFVKLKSSEIRRYESYVTDWEHREYFEVF